MRPLSEYTTIAKEYIIKYWYIFAALILAVLASLGAYLYINYVLATPVPRQPKQQDTLPKVPPKQEPPVNKGATCPLDGAPLEEFPEQRILAVSIDNSPEARPQSGLKDADLVIELPVEGGITRLLAFYYHKDAARIGPVRSARPYLAAKAQEYGAVLVHAGKSPQTNDYFVKYKTEHIDEMPSTPGFWREAQRKAPHNLYTSKSNMVAFLNKAGLTGMKNLNGLIFGDNILTDAQDSSKLTIFYPYGEVAYEFQPVDKDYLRFISGKAHIDAESYLPLRIKNIIVQYVKTRVIDGEGRLVMELNSKGRAVFVTGGKTLEGSWVKDPQGNTKYMDLKGNEIKLSPGQTWIEIVQDNIKIDY